MDALKKVFKVIGTILFKMHFWLPLVYTIVFIVFSAISGTLVENWGIYFIGLSVAMILSLLLVYREKAGQKAEATPKDKNKKEPEEKKVVYVVPPEGTEDAEEKARTIVIEKNPGFDANHPEIAPSVNYQKEIDAAMEKQKATPSDTSFGYSAESFRYEPAQSPRPQQPSYYEEAKNIEPIVKHHDDGDAPVNELSSDFSQYLSPHEPLPAKKEPVFHDPTPVKPKVYRTRTDPSIIIYDYPDKIERYRIMQDGSISLVSIDRKP